MQCVAVQFVAVVSSELQCIAVCVAVCCSALQCVADVCCSVFVCTSPWIEFNELYGLA